MKDVWSPNDWLKRGEWSTIPRANILEQWKSRETQKGAITNKEVLVALQWCNVSSSGFTCSQSKSFECHTNSCKGQKSANPSTGRMPARQIEIIQNWKSIRCLPVGADHAIILMLAIQIDSGRSQKCKLCYLQQNHNSGVVLSNWSYRDNVRILQTTITTWRVRAWRSIIAWIVPSHNAYQARQPATKLRSITLNIINNFKPSHHMTNRVLPAMKYSEPFP